MRLLLALSFVGAAGLQAAPVVPEVSAKEAAVLARVQSIASTNQVQALSLLDENAGDAAGAASACMRGNLLMQLDRSEDAVRAYEEALKLLPDYTDALVNLGRAHVMLDAPDKALAVYRRVIALGEADAEIYLVMGHAFLMKEQPVSAETAFREVLLRQVDDQDARRGLAKALLDQERYKDAAAIVRELLAVAPSDAELWAIRVNVLLQQDRLDEAVVAIETASRVSSLPPTLLLTLGDLYVRREQPANAVVAYEAAFALEPPHVDTLLRIADSFLRVDELERCRAYLQRSGALLKKKKMSEAAARARVLKARLAFREENYTDARSLAAAGLKDDPLDGALLILMGDIAAAQKQVDDAVVMYRRAARVDGYRADARIRHAQLEVSQQRVESAVRLLEEALALKPSPHVKRYLERLKTFVDER